MTDPTTPESVDASRPTIMELLAERFGMSEGQLYTAVIALAVAVLLTVTGVPNARQRSDTDAFSGSGSVPTLPTATSAPPTTAPTATSAPDATTPPVPEEAP